MTTEQVVDVINYIKSKYPHFTIEFIHKDNVNQYDVCFYRVLDQSCTKQGLENLLGKIKLDIMHINSKLAIVIKVDRK